MTCIRKDPGKSWFQNEKKNSHNDDSPISEASLEPIKWKNVNSEMTAWSSGHQWPFDQRLSYSLIDIY